MVWLTGGGNHSLSGQGSAGFGGVVDNGEQVVPEGVVFVSYNLRLGALGFLAHPALDAERPEKISGNYGSLDQDRSEEHTSELQSQSNLVCRLLLEKKKRI